MRGIWIYGNYYVGISYNTRGIIMIIVIIMFALLILALSGCIIGGLGINNGKSDELFTIIGGFILMAMIVASLYVGMQ